MFLCLRGFLYVTFVLNVIMVMRMGPEKQMRVLINKYKECIIIQWITIAIWMITIVVLFILRSISNSSIIEIANISIFMEKASLLFMATMIFREIYLGIRGYTPNNIKQ
jgi:predicted Abi (CAAX) family protease